MSLRESVLVTVDYETFGDGYEQLEATSVNSPWCNHYNVKCDQPTMPKEPETSTPVSTSCNYTYLSNMDVFGKRIVFLNLTTFG